GVVSRPPRNRLAITAATRPSTAATTMGMDRRGGTAFAALRAVFFTLRCLELRRSVIRIRVPGPRVPQSRDRRTATRAQRGRDGGARGASRGRDRRRAPGLRAQAEGPRRARGRPARGRRGLEEAVAVGGPPAAGAPARDAGVVAERALEVAED